MNVRVGGDFYYDPKENDIKHTLLLVAGGVGINPIISIFGHAAGLYEKYPTAEWIPKQIHLLYSAKDAHELIFKVCQLTVFYIVCNKLFALFLFI